MSSSHAFNQAFPRTEPGEFDVKVLPAARLLECKGEGNYFHKPNILFGLLLSYIKKRGIAMIEPVEARIEPGTMYFWVADDEAEKAVENSGKVRVIDVEERMVAAMGARGSYSESNYRKAKTALLKWIATENDLQAIGKPYTVYWDGPFKLGILKKFEVHVRVRRKHWEG